MEGVLASVTESNTSFSSFPIHRFEATTGIDKSKGKGVAGDGREDSLSPCLSTSDIRSTFFFNNNLAINWSHLKQAPRI